MRSTSPFRFSCLLSLLALSSAFAQNKINPGTQINWPISCGPGTDAPYFPGLNQCQTGGGGSGNAIAIQGKPVSSQFPANSNSSLVFNGQQYQLQLPTVNSGAANILFTGDSVAETTGATTIANGYASLVAAAITGGPSTNAALSGSGMADIVNDQIMGRPLSPSIQTNNFLPTYNSGLTIEEGGINDAAQTNALNTNQQVAYNQYLYEAIVTRLIPTINLIQGNNTSITTSGTVAPDTFYSVFPGLSMTSAGASVNFSITTTGGPIYIAFPVFANDTGNFTVKINNVASSDTITQSSTIANAPFGGAALNEAFAYNRTAALARFAVSAPGTYAIQIVCNAVGTNGCGFIYAGTPSSQLNWGLPTVAMLGVIKQQGDALSTATALYDGLNQAAATQLSEDTGNVYFVPVRNYITSANLNAAMSSTDGANPSGLQLTDVTTTTNNSIITSPSHAFSFSDIGKLVYCEGVGTAGATFRGSVQSWTLATPNNLQLTSNIPIGQTNTTCFLGYLGQIFPASASPGKHPDDYGHALIAQAVLNTLQPVSSPAPLNFPITPNFMKGINVTGNFNGIGIQAPNQLLQIQQVLQPAGATLNFTGGVAGGSGANGYVIGGPIGGQIVINLGTSPTSGALVTLIFGTGTVSGCGFSQEGQTSWYGLNVVVTANGGAISVANSLSTATSPLVIDYNCRGSFLSQNIPLQGFSITSNVVTLNGGNAFTVGQHVELINMPSVASFLNNVVLTVTASTGGTFSANFTHANVAQTTLTGGNAVPSFP